MRVSQLPIFLWGNAKATATVTVTARYVSYPLLSLSSFLRLFEDAIISHFCFSFCIFKGSLICTQRSGIEDVPGCIGSGVSGWNYCYDPNPGATAAPGTVTYVPGEATVYEKGLLLSTGLTSRIIATMDYPVQYDIGGQSIEKFHSAPDGKNDNACVPFIFYLFACVFANLLLQNFCDDLAQALPSLKTRIQADGSMFRTLRLDRTEVLVLSPSTHKAK
jgi:hypothetical protein